MATCPKATCLHSRQDKEKGKEQKGVLAKIPPHFFNRCYPRTSDYIREGGKVIFRIWMHCCLTQDLSSVSKEEEKLYWPQEHNSYHNWDIFFHSWLTLEAQRKLCHSLQAALMNKIDANSV